MRAADIMTTEIVHVDPETDVLDVAQLLLEQRIRAAPVINRHGLVVGIVSEVDLALRTARQHGHHCWFSLFANKTAEFGCTHGTCARDLMTHPVVSISKDASLAEIAQVLDSHAVHQVPVLEAGWLVGIVSRGDVRRGLESLTDDLAVREQILGLLKKKKAAMSRQAAVSVIVLNGVVYLWGVVETQAQRTKVRLAAETVVGPRKVRDQVSTLSQVRRALRARD